MPEQVDLDAQRMRSLVPLYISIAGITTAVFIGDLLTPLGVAIWILYVVPLGMTLFDRNPMQPINVALVITVLMVITVFTDQPGLRPGWHMRIEASAPLWSGLWPCSPVD